MGRPICTDTFVVGVLILVSLYGVQSLKTIGNSRYQCNLQSSELTVILPVDPSNSRSNNGVVDQGICKCKNGYLGLLCQYSDVPAHCKVLEY
jgi:hypothetical protein